MLAIIDCGAPRHCPDSEPCPASLGELSSKEQWDIHAYFLPNKELDAEALLAHRAKITKQPPSLPQCAGRAERHLHHLVQRFATLPNRAPVAATSGRRTNVRVTNVTVRALVNPEPDFRKLALMLIDIADKQLKAKRAAKASGLGQAQDSATPTDDASRPPAA